MKKILPFFTFFLIFFFSSAQNIENFSRVELNLSSKQQLELLLINGVNVENGLWTKNSCVLELSDSEQEILNHLNIPFQVLIPNMSAFYQSRNQNSTIESINKKIKNDRRYRSIPSQFNLGSIGGYFSLSEMYAEIHDMAQLYPQLISDTIPISAAQTVNGNHIYYVKMESMVNPSIQKPQVMLTALTHAREPAGMQQLLFFMWYLLENYETDPEIKFLVDYLELIFVPCVNPDGYHFNCTQSPNGGGMWRKNRRNNGNNTWGVDLNRNYGYQWGYDNTGSSPFGNQETYRGTAPFSEVETQQIKILCESNQFSLAINNHCYGNMLIYPWGHVAQKTPDSLLFSAYAKQLTAENNFVYGTCYEVLNYNANGGSSDWFYGEQTTKNKIFEFSPEAGDPLDGFWPAAEQIIPICTDYLPMNLALLRLALPFPLLEDISEPTTSETNFFFHFNLTSLGNVDHSSFEVSLSPISSNIVSLGNSIQFSNMERLEMQTDSIAIQIGNNMQQGDSIVFVAMVDMGGFVSQDTIVKYYGEATVLINDSDNQISNWTSNGWDVTSTHFYSPPFSYTDSPSGDYAESTYSNITLNAPLDLTNAVYAYIDFYARWALETNYDFVQLMVSSDQGLTWILLESQHTSVGTAYQDQGNPVYHGFRNEWVNETISLAPFLGQNILLKFELISDMSQNEDGFYFDDFKVVKITGSDISIAEPIMKHKAYYAADIESLIITIDSYSEPVHFQIWDSKGALVLQSVLKQNRNVIPLSNLKNALYIVTFDNGNAIKIIKY